MIFLIIFIGIILFAFVLVIALASKGFRNKFGPEWVPGELQIRFNILCKQQEDFKTIRFFLTPPDADNILRQLDDLIRTDIEKSKSGFKPLNHIKLFSWSMIDQNTFEYRNNKTDKLKAVFKLDVNELIYYK